MKIRNILITVAIVVIVGTMLFFALSRPRQHVWDIRHLNPSDNGDEPYEMSLFDELMMRSVDNGYSVQLVEPNDTIEEYHVFENESTDTTLLVIQHYYWDYNINLPEEIVNLARRGGHVVFVPGHSYRCEKYFNNLYGNQFDFQYDVYVPSENYSLEWIKSYLKSKSKANVSNKSNEHYDIFPVVENLLYTPKEPTNTGTETRPHKVTSLLNDSENRIISYAVKIYYPQTGGELIISPLSMYFCNLGVTLPNADRVLDDLIGEVDSRPIKRVEYSPHYKNQKNKESYGEYYSSGMPALAKIFEDPGLNLAWQLTLLMAVLLIANGLFRRQPVDRHAIEDIPDESDRVAMKRWEMRHSPTLSFLFQCSGLYSKSSDHTELFNTNMRRMSRIVSRYTHIELATATDDELREAADILARQMRGHDQPGTVTQDLDQQADKIYKDLKWMQDTNNDFNKKAKVTTFVRSQRIVEKYPPN